MTSGRDSDLKTMIAELEAELSAADPAKRATIEAQIDSLRRSLSMAATAKPSLARVARPELSQEAREIFTPEPAAQVPTWLPDMITRDQVTEATVRCPAGARVYVTETSVGCAIPNDIGGAPIWHGLTLSFYRSKRLQSQRFYENGRLRWSVEYHPTGGRASVGFFVDRELKVHREHGLHTSYAPGGAVCAQVMWSNGVRHGWTKLWEDDGYPVGATLYDQGRAIEHVLADGTRRVDRR